MSDQASELFWNALECGGAPQATCSCGRIHFACGTRAEHEEGELKKLIEDAGKHPGKYVAYHIDDSIAIATIDGVPFCYGCPCGKLARYENFIWHNRGMILKYLKARADKEAAEAFATQEQLKSL